MITVEELRQSMTIKHSKLDPEIKRAVDACLLDLQMAGVNKNKDSPLLDTACELYCKWKFDYMGQADRYEKAYKELRDSMSLCGLYKGDGNEE